MATATATAKPKSKAPVDHDGLEGEMTASIMAGRPAVRARLAAAVLLLGATVLLLAAPLPARGAEDKPEDCEATTAASRASTRLITLGTGGGPVVRATRSQPATLVIAGGTPYLVDAGDGVERQLVAAGLHPEDVRNVFVTHLHLDHTADLANLVAFNWISLTARKMRIFGPPGTQQTVRAGIEYLAIPESIHAAQIPPAPHMRDLVDVTEVDLTRPTVIFEDANVRVTAVANSHYDVTRFARQPYGEVRSYSYRFDTADRSIVISGDTGPSDAVVELARGADVLVSEVLDLCSTLAYIRRGGATDAQLGPLTAHMKRQHLQPEEIGRMAARAGVKMVVLTHFGLGFDGEHDMTLYTAGVRKHFAGPVVAASDLQEF
jgi:ribonuclease BN (tRNA processing enzyme)